MKKNDFLLIAVLLLLGLGVVVYTQITKNEGSKVRILINDEEYKVFNLSENITHTIELENGGHNTFQIKDGYVEMLDASCPDKICVKHKKIHYSNEDIVCLPNQIIIKIIDGEESDIDAIAN